MPLPEYSRLFAAPVAFDPIYRLIETLIVAGAALVAQLLFSNETARNFDLAVTMIAILLAWGVMFARSSRKGARQPDTWRALLLPPLGWLLCEAGALGIVEWAHREYTPSMHWLVCVAATTAAGVFACRAAGRLAGARRARSCAVAIVGRSDHCDAFVQRIASTPNCPYRIDAQFDMEPGADVPRNGVQHFHDMQAFAAHVRASRIDELWLALPLTDESTLLRFLDVFRNDLLNIRFVPDVSRVAFFTRHPSGFDGAFAINLVASPLNEHALIGKSIFDRIFAACVLLAISPLLLGIALAVRLSSPGPVLFTQRRHGANGQPFNILKFRTMRVHDANEGQVVQATRGDPRITPVGAFLRRTSLDELPQFINVLRGDMSVIGPRPHAIEHDALYQDVVDGYIQRYRIKPGITGWAQINGLRGETDSIEKMQKRVEHDLYYLSNWSFALDMRILLATISRGFVHQNAY